MLSDHFSDLSRVPMKTSRCIRHLVTAWFLQRSSLAIQADCLSGLKTAQHLRDVTFVMHAYNIDGHLTHMLPSLESLQLYGSCLSPSALARLTSINSLKVSQLSLSLENSVGQVVSVSQSVCI